jgi:hypothetical protein
VIIFCIDHSEMENNPFKTTQMENLFYVSLNLKYKRMFTKYAGMLVFVLTVSTISLDRALIVCQNMKYIVLCYGMVLNGSSCITQVFNSVACSEIHGLIELFCLSSLCV